MKVIRAFGNIIFMAAAIFFLFMHVHFGPYALPQSAGSAGEGGIFQGTG